MLYNICFSPTGGTAKVAEILARAISDESVFLDLCVPTFAGATLREEDIAVIAVPSYGGRVPVTAMERLEKVQGNGAKAILVCAYGNRTYDDTLAEMKSLAQRAAFLPIAAVAALAEHSVVRAVGCNRPDDKDSAILRMNMAPKIKFKLESGDISPVRVPGTVPGKPAPSFGDKLAPQPFIDCLRCGICADQCPAEAIDRNTMLAKQSKCIGCQRCVTVCPHEKRELPLHLDNLGGVPIRELCRKRKENELFL